MRASSAPINIITGKILSRNVRMVTSRKIIRVKNRGHNNSLGNIIVGVKRCKLFNVLLRKLTNFFFVGNCLKIKTLHPDKIYQVSVLR